MGCKFRWFEHLLCALLYVGYSNKIYRRILPANLGSVHLTSWAHPLKPDGIASSFAGNLQWSQAGMAGKACPND